MANSIVYLEIPAGKFEATKEFYRSVFNWNIEDSNLVEGAQYAMFNSNGDKGITMGGLDASQKPIPADTMKLYISVDDISATLTKVTQSSGEIVKEKTPIGGDFGFYAIFKDTNGNHLGLHSND